MPATVDKRWRSLQASDLDDVRQAGSLGLIYAARHYDPARSRGRFVAFAQRCIHGAAVDHLRAMLRQTTPLQLETEVLDTGADTVGEVHVGMVREELMRTLPERSAMMAQLYFFEGHSALAIGQRFGISESMVCRLLRPVRERLRELLRG